MSNTIVANPWSEPRRPLFCSWRSRAPLFQARRVSDSTFSAAFLSSFLRYGYHDSCKSLLRATPAPFLFLEVADSTFSGSQRVGLHFFGSLFELLFALCLTRLLQVLGARFKSGVGGFLECAMGGSAYIILPLGPDPTRPPTPQNVEESTGGGGAAAPCPQTMTKAGRRDRSL